MSSTTRTPRPFQAEGIAWLDSIERGILGDDPGLGKTGQALLAATEPVLVIGPAALKGTWEDEVALWRPDLVWEFVSYSSVCARKPNAKGHMTVVDSFPRPEYMGFRWGTVICDEAHYLKGRNTKWTQAIATLKYDRLFLLTGTPVPNWSYEIYMLLRLMYPGDRRFSSFWRWAEHWFAVWEPKWGGRKIGRLKAEYTWADFIEANTLDERMLRRSRDDVLTDLPPMTPQTIECPMVPKQRKAYAELKDTYLTWVDGHGEAIAWSAGQLHSHLSQITTGLDTMTDGAATGSGKLDRLAEDMAERRHSPTVIACHYKATARAVARLLDRMGLAYGMITGDVTQANVDISRRAFQDGGLSVLVGTNDKMSEGMTFTAADTLIHVERSWRPSRNDQMIRRIHRMGQTRPCHYITYVTPDSIDDAMTATLAEKSDEQMGMLTAHAFARLLKAGT